MTEAERPRRPSPSLRRARGEVRAVPSATSPPSWFDKSFSLSVDRCTHEVGDLPDEEQLRELRESQGCVEHIPGSSAGFHERLLLATDGSCTWMTPRCRRPTVYAPKKKNHRRVTRRCADDAIPISTRNPHSRSALKMIALHWPTAKALDGRGRWCGRARPVVGTVSVFGSALFEVAPSSRS